MSRRPYRQLNILVTENCGRSCAKCVYRKSIRGVEQRHFDIKELLRYSDYFRHLDSIYITGGEPLLHPDIREIVRAFRKHLQPRLLKLATFGDELAIENIDVLRTVDLTLISGQKNGVERARAIRRVDGSIRLALSSERHVDIPLEQKISNARACHRKRTPIYADGLLYPCCIAYGIPGSDSMEPTPSWKRELTTLELPCGWCGFAV